MPTIIITILTSILGGGAVSWVSKNLMMLGISAALLVVTNGISGVVWYVKGHNSAAAQCHVNTLVRERDELKRDRDIAKFIAEKTTVELRTLQEREDARAIKEATDAANIKPIEGCVITDPTPPARRVRKLRPQ